MLAHVCILQHIDRSCYRSEYHWGEASLVTVPANKVEQLFAGISRGTE